jgi:apolipoprotein N-acyltransferase
MQVYREKETAMARHLRMTHELEKKGVELVIWSESSVTHAAPTDNYKTEYKNYVGKQLGIAAIFGGILFEPEASPDIKKHPRVYNSAIGSDAQGNITGRYDKEFLLAFGEYLPFGETFPVLYEWSPNSGHFTSGTALDPIPVKTDSGTHNVSVLICYEDIIQSYTNRMVSYADPELLVNMTNDAWFGDTSEPWEHLALSQFRAIEHHRYFIRATNSGVSAIIDPVGRVIVHSGTFRQETGDAIAHWMHGRTVYEVVGDVPVWLMTLITIAGAFVRRKKKASSPPGPEAGPG